MSVDRAPLWRRLAAEFLGSTFLAAIVVGSGIAAQRLSPHQVGLELLENAAATALGLFAIILMFGPVSGGHFNPVVSFVDAAFGGLRWRSAMCYLSAQCAGCIAGAIVANLMFSDAAVSFSTKHRATGAHFLSEIVATAGLILLDIRPRQEWEKSQCTGGGWLVHRGGVLLHELHQFRQPCDHRRKDVLRHICGNRAVVGPGIRGCPDGRGSPGVLDRQVALSGDDQWRGVRDRRSTQRRFG